MKVLLAGGAGYIGTEFVDMLLERGHTVDVYDMCMFGNAVNEKANVIKKDIFEITDNEIKTYDAVVFLAGLSNDPMANFSPSMNFIENTSVPIYLAFLCKKNNIEKFVFASSCSVYGFTDNKPMTELDYPKPQYAYGISKLAAETTIINMADYTFRPICFRKGTVGGYSKRMRFDLVVNAMTKSAITTNTINVNNPNIWRPLVDVRDVCTAYTKAVECDTSISGIYNLTQGNYTIGELASLVQEALQDHGYSADIITNNTDDIRNYKATNDKAKEDLDFKALYSPKDTVYSILEHIEEFEDFNDHKYYNIQVMKKELNEK